MNELEQYRLRINEIDDQMIKLLEERLAISTKIGDYKRQYNIPIQDLKREKFILDKVRGKVETEEYKDAIEKLYNLMLSISKTFQY